MSYSISDPLISVIVPVHNTEQYLRRCIISIQKQTYKNLEILCIDDGSTDKSGLILDELSKYDKRLKIVHTKNKGVSEARNIALRLSSGEFISFVDSDDYIEPEMYTLMSQRMQEAEVDIVACGYSMVYENEIVKIRNKSKVPEGVLDAIRFLEYIYERDIYKGVAGYVCTRLFRRYLIMGSEKNIRIEFDNSLSFGEDVVFMAEVSIKAKTVMYIPEALYNYVQHEKSAVHNKEKQLEKLDWISAYEHAIEIYEKNNVPPKIVNLVKRMYVYRCGKTLEIAFENKRKDKCIILKNYIKNNLFTYIDANIDYPDRIQWINSLLQKDC